MAMTQQVPVLYNINVKNTFIDDATLEGHECEVAAMKRHASEPELSTLPGTSTYQINWCYASKADALDALVSSGKKHADPSLAPTTADSLMLVEDLEVDEEESDCGDAESDLDQQEVDQDWTTWNDTPCNNAFSAPAPAATQAARPVGPVFGRALNPQRWVNEEMPPMEECPGDFDFSDEAKFGAFFEDEPVSRQPVGQPAVRLAFSNGAPKPAHWAKVTTVMLKNMPNKVTQSALVLELHAAGFQNSYDFVHVPMDVMTKVNRGYAFINFINADLAFAFTMEFEGRKFNNAKFPSGKVTSVCPAVIQGFEANYAHYSQTNFKHRDAVADPLFLRTPEGCKPAGCKNFISKHRAPSLIDLAAAQMATKQNIKQQCQQQCQQELTAEAPNGMLTSIISAALQMVEAVDFQVSWALPSIAPKDGTQE